MAGLLSEGGESSEFRYEPWETSSVGLASVLVVVGLLSLALLYTPQVLPRIALVISLGMLLLGLFHVGYTYGLTKDELVVRRFHVERGRFPLSQLQRTDVFLWWPRLFFAGRRVVLPYTFSNGSWAFAAEVALQAARCGNSAMSRLSQRLDDAHVRLPVARLVLPDACVVCGSVASSSVGIARSQPLMPTLVLELPAAVCGPHRLRHAVVSTLGEVAVFLAGALVSLVLLLILVAPAHRWHFGLAVLSTFPGVVTWALARRFGLHAWCDERSLGLRVTEVSADRQWVVLRFRTPKLRDEIVRLTDLRVQAYLEDGQATPGGPSPEARDLTAQPPTRQ